MSFQGEHLVEYFFRVREFTRSQMETIAAKVESQIPPEVSRALEINCYVVNQLLIQPVMGVALLQIWIVGDSFYEEGTTLCLDTSLNLEEFYGIVEKATDISPEIIAIIKKTKPHAIKAFESLEYHFTNYIFPQSEAKKRSFLKNISKMTEDKNLFAKLSRITYGHMNQF